MANYYAAKKFIKADGTYGETNKYGTKDDMEYQYCLFRANSVKNTDGNQLSVCELGTLEKGATERKVYHHPVPEPEPETEAVEGE